MTTGEKIVLGHRIKAGGGERDGEEVLDMLAAHPSTARFIATKLVRRFVSDNPPASLVDRAAATFRQTRRGSARGDAGHPDIAGISLARGVSREGEDAVRVSHQRASGHGADVQNAAAARAGACSSWGCRCISASRQPATRTRPTPG